MSKVWDHNLKNIESIYVQRFNRLPTADEIFAYNLGFMIAFKDVSNTEQ